MNNLKLGRIILSVCQTNCYYIYLEGSKEAIVVDPADKGETIFNELSKNGLTCAGILLTHAHFDHMLGMKRLQQLSGAEAYCNIDEKVVCENADINLSTGFMRREYTIEPEHWVKDGDEIELAGMKCKMIATPGHTCGSCCYYFEEYNLLVTGDTLFQGSVGRTDFETGSMSQIVRSIKEKLYVLPEETICLPGHGECTTIGDEKAGNPFTA